MGMVECLEETPSESARCMLHRPVLHLILLALPGRVQHAAGPIRRGQPVACCTGGFYIGVDQRGPFLRGQPVACCAEGPIRWVSPPMVELLERGATQPGGRGADDRGTE